MKSFSQYLTESTKTYEFKLKIAGELDSNIQETLKDAFAKFSIVHLSAGKRTPIREVPLDFPDMENSRVTVWDVEIKYPTTPQVLEQHIATATNCPLHCVKVRNCNEPMEQYQKEEEAKATALLNDPVMSSPDAKVHELVGEKRLTGMLKDLANAARKTGDQYKDINPEILAKDSHKEKPSEMPDVKQGVSPVGSRQNKIPTPHKGK